MTNRLNRPGTIGALGVVALLGGGCVAPPPAPIELTVTIREAGICCLAGNLVTCRDRTADLKDAYADPDKLHHTLPELGYSDFDRPGTVEHDRGSTIEHDRGDTVEHDLLRCKFRNRQLHDAFKLCHQDLNDCRADAGANCVSEYMACYHAALAAGPFARP